MTMEHKHNTVFNLHQSVTRYIWVRWNNSLDSIKDECQYYPPNEKYFACGKEAQTQHNSRNTPTYISFYTVSTSHD